MRQLSAGNVSLPYTHCVYSDTLNPVNSPLPHLPPFEIKPSHVPSAFVVAQGENPVVNKLIITGKDAGRELRRAIAAYVEDLEPTR
ncbi:MAG: hypothetical protein ACOVP2_06265, partial [Armatimonadaceae bacterium]